MRGKFVRLLPLVAVVSAVAALGVPESPALAATPDRLAALDARMLSGDQQLSVTWRYATTGPPATNLVLDLYKVEGTTRIKVASALMGRTIEPDSYEIPLPAGSWMVIATPRNAAGGGMGTASAVVPISNPCATAAMCARVSTSPTPTPVRLAAQGFLSGTEYAVNVNGAKVAPLRPIDWRLAWRTADVAARKVGATRMQVISVLWEDVTAPKNGGYARTPWSDWETWQYFVLGAVQNAKKGGWSPDYWDVWNEPNGLCCPRFSPADLTTVTVDRWLEMYARAWRVIKFADPSAKVVGPSTSSLQWAPGAPREFDLDTFLSYSAAQGIKWDAVSWHESTDAPSAGEMLYSPNNVDHHIAMAKAVLARHPGTVVNNSIIVNEYGAKEGHMLAGRAIDYFRALESGGVRLAHRACWSNAECTTTLDGLLTANGDVTALWWAHRLYADLTAGVTMQVSSSSSWQLSGLATRDDATSAVRVLLGRHWGCNRAVNAWCQWTGVVAPASLAVTIDWPYGTAPVNVTIDRLPAGTGAVAAPQRLQSVVLTPNAGTLTLGVPVVQDGDGLSIVARPN